LVFRRGTPPDAEYTFKHALVQDAAYSTLLRSRRQQLHGRIVETLEGQFPEIVEAQPGLLAQHCAEAGLVTKAATYWLRAGQMAAAQSANAEAVSHLRKALDLLPAWPDPKDRDRLELQMQISLGPALIALKGYSAHDTVVAYERARELIRTTGDRTQQDVVLTGVFVCYYNLAAYERSLEVGQEFLQSAIEMNEAVPLCIGHRMLAVSYNTLGRFGEARHHAEQALCHYDPGFHSALAWRYVHDLGVAAMCHRAIALWHLGFPDQSAATEQQALTLAAKLNHHNTTGYALFYAGVLSAFRRREMAALTSFAERVIAHGRQHELPQWVAWGSFFQAPLLTGAGRADQAIATIEEALSAADRMQNRVYRPIVHGMLAEARLAQGNNGAAVELSRQALAIAEQTGEQWMGSELWRINGNIQASIDDTNGAQLSFRNGIDLARCQGSRMLELRCTVSVARLLRDQGKRDEARELLAPTYGWFTEGFDTLDLEQAKAMLDELG
jgi:predicted ATPase